MALNTIFKVLAVFLVFVFSFNTGKAQFTLTEYTSDITITGVYAELYEDTSRTLSFQDVQKKEFRKTGIENLKNVNPSFAYWLRFHINNRAVSSLKWVLENLTPNLYSLKVWIPDEKGKMKMHAGGLGNESFKPYPHKNYVFDLPSTLKEYDIYIRVWSPNVTGIEFKIRSQKFFTWYAVNEYYFLGIYYGILLIMMLYNLLVFITNREKVYFFYSLYLTSCMFLSLTEDGLGIEFLWESLTAANLYFYYYLAPSCFLLSFVLYARSFLQLKKNFPLADKVVMGMAIIYVSISLLQSVTRDVFRLEDYFIIPFVFVLAASVYVYKKGFKSARFFILGYSIVFLSMIVLQLRLHRVIEANIFTVYIFNFGILVEAVILSFALADRLRIIRKEKKEADKQIIAHLKDNAELQERLVVELKEKNELSEKVNRELEQKVQERTKDLLQKTQELTNANEKLDLYAQKLKEMNVSLDVKNWELEKEVKEERKARVVHREMSYQEFTKVFPDKNTCLRYLENLKWANGFSCRKCGNEKFTQKLFSRKCTTCDYLESPTSNTLLHGIKIPLEKAFYLIYAANKKSKKLTLDEMSALLKVGKNTCWNFQKRIKQRHEEKMKLSGVKESENWDSFILD